MSKACTTGACSTPNAHLLSVELDGVTVTANECIELDTWVERLDRSGKPTRDQGEFTHGVREHDGSITVFAYTRTTGFRAVPARMAHPCAASSGEGR